MDTNLLLTLVIALLSINLLLVGFYIAMVLKEVRETVRKVNKLLDTTGSMAEAVSEPVIGASRALNGLTSGLSVYNLVKAFKQKRNRPSVSSISNEE